jgi:hypothetical protein
MAELERSLVVLAREIEWPATPRLVVAIAPSRRSRRAVIVAVGLAAIVLAVGVAFAVPSARSAILRLFGFGGVTIERVSTLPAAEDRPLASTLGTPIGPDVAARMLGGPVRLPPGSEHARLYADGDVVSLLFGAPTPTLLSEFRSGIGAEILKKLAGGSTEVEWLEVAADAPGVWITGEAHVFIGPTAPPRLAGNVLLWQSGEITYRLEGRELTRSLALRLAREIAA